MNDKEIEKIALKHLDKNNECLHLRVAIVQNIVAINEYLETENNIKRICNLIDNSKEYYNVLDIVDIFSYETYDKLNISENNIF